MALNLENNALFSSLQKLYSRVMLRAYDARTQAYRKNGQGAQEHDISTSLTGQLDKLAASGAAAASNGAPPVSRQPRSPAPARTPVPSRKRTDSEQELVTRTLEGLSRDLKSGHTGAVSQPAMSHKLKSSAWTHLHAAVRLARQGDVAASKVHADIANQALKEVAHYMTDTDYAAFVAEVESELSDIAAETATVTAPK